MVINHQNASTKQVLIETLTQLPETSSFVASRLYHDYLLKGHVQNV